LHSNICPDHVTVIPSWSGFPVSFLETQCFQPFLVL